MNSKFKIENIQENSDYSIYRDTLGSVRDWYDSIQLREEPEIPISNWR